MNVNLGGDPSVWTNPPVLPATNLGVFTDLGVSGPYTGFSLDYGIYSPGSNLVTTNYVALYQLTNPVVGAWYAGKGGNGAGTILMPPGLSTFPGMAATAAWSKSPYIQAINNNLPILYEQWFDNNPTRANPLIAYSNYTLWNDQPNVVPYISGGVSVRRFNFGIFDVTTDVATATAADTLAGALFGINPLNSAEIIVEIVFNRVVVATETFTGTATSVTGFVETAGGSYTPAVAGLLAGTINEIDVGWSGGGSGSLYHASATAENIDFFDAWRTKWAWYVDYDNGLGAGVPDVNNPIGARMPCMFTHPGWAVPCPPAELTYTPVNVSAPLILQDTFTGSGYLAYPFSGSHTGEIGAVWVGYTGAGVPALSGDSNFYPTTLSGGTVVFDGYDSWSYHSSGVIPGAGVEIIVVFNLQTANDGAFVVTTSPVLTGNLYDDSLRTGTTVRVVNTTNAINSRIEVKPYTGASVTTVAIPAAVSSVARTLRIRSGPAGVQVSIDGIKYFGNATSTNNSGRTINVRAEGVTNGPTTQFDLITARPTLS
jgi:hypothetical protein